MTVINYTITAFIIGIPVGIMYGCIFGFIVLVDMGWKDGMLFFVGCIIGSPLFLSLLTFIFMGLLSIIHPNLTLL